MSDQDRRQFGAHLARLRARARLSQRSLALRLCAASGSTTPTRNEISRWERGGRVPDAWLPTLASVLGEPLDALERAAQQARGPRPETVSGGTRPNSDVFVENSVGRLLTHSSRHGGDHVADAALQVWRAQRTQITTEDHRHTAAVSEIGEIAGWLLHDAARYDEARATLHEAQTLARLAGDGPLEWFILDMIAMNDLQAGNPDVARGIADELLDNRGLRGRVALMAHVRRARSLAQAGDRRRTLDALERAAGALQDSIHPNDPAFTWWIDSTEVSLHTGEALLSLGEARAALPHLQRSSAASRDGGRRAFGNILAELHAYALLGAWREAEAPLTRLAPVLRTVTSSRTRQRLAKTVSTIERDAPTWLVETAHDVVTGGS